MATTRVLRGLVPVEVGVLIAAAVLASRLPIPVVIPLLAAASISLWLRGRSFSTVTKGPTWLGLIGAAAGALALVLALLVGTPIIETVLGEAVQWSMYPIVRGSPTAFVMLAILVVLSAVAAELVLRGWILERVLELGAHPALAVVVAALAEAAVVGNVGETVGTSASLPMRAGAAVFGLALGWMYVASGRSVVPAICARAAFVLGALVLEALRVVG
jgi:membrane protease YdiL (CAAX protease family)